MCRGRRSLHTQHTVVDFDKFCPKIMSLLPKKSVQYDYMSSNYNLWMMFFVLFNQKITLLCISNCISPSYKDNVPHNFWTKLENSVHSTAVTACSSGNSGSSLFKAHRPEIFHIDLVLKMSMLAVAEISFNRSSWREKIMTTLWENVNFQLSVVYLVLD